MELLIRKVELEDYKRISEIRKMDGVIENILATKDESEDKIKERIINKSERDYWYILELNCELVGLAILNGHVNPRKKHAASITLMVDSRYHGIGIGKRLMETLIKESEKFGIIRLELAVFNDNVRAINLYKSFGFIEEGVKKKSAVKNGKYVDEIIMARINENN